jgi:hypothetical protein
MAGSRDPGTNAVGPRLPHASEPRSISSYQHLVPMSLLQYAIYSTPLLHDQVYTYICYDSNSIPSSLMLCLDIYY